MKEEKERKSSNIGCRDAFCYTCIFTLGMAIPVLLNNRLIENEYDKYVVLYTSLVYLTSSLILRVTNYLKGKKLGEIDSIELRRWQKLELFNWSLCLSSFSYYLESLE